MTTLKLTKYKCKICNGDLYEKNIYKRFYCSQKCYDDSHSKKCLICNNTFMAYAKHCVFCNKCVNVPSMSHKIGTGILGIWDCMMYRCYNPSRNSYQHYGAKGIRVDPAWFNFETFINDMGTRPDGYTLDRIDSSKNYSKENCRWVTINEQRINRDRFSNATQKYKGVCPHGNKWKAGIRHNSKSYYLGLFDTELEAALAYDIKVKEFYPITYKQYVNIKV